ncbi:MAG: cytochrome P450 [Terriglobia bacterium]
MTTFSSAPRPPGPRNFIPGLWYVAFRRDPIHFFMRLARRYGDVVYFHVGPQRVFLLNHPDLIRDVLVTHDSNFVKGRGLERAKMLLGDGLLTSEGALHRRQRRLMQPAFHRDALPHYGDIMAQSAEQAQLSWKDGAILDVDHEMKGLTLSIVGRSLFGAELETEAGELGEAFTTALKMWQRLMLPFAEKLEKFPLPSVRKFQKARARLDQTIYRMIAERRNIRGTETDLLSLLLMARDTEADGGDMTDLQLRDEVMTLFLAGHETTANALTWTWYLLSQNPSVEARFHAEIDQLPSGKLPSVDDLPRLTYTESLLKESMRMYPPAWLVGRRALQDYAVPPYLIPAGSLVLMSQYVMHHDARYFEDPFRFNPDRWNEDVKTARPKFAYFPFGGGPRQCIGEGFAWMEGILLLTALGQRWKFRLVPGHRVALQPLVTLRPKFGMKMISFRRGK